MIEMKLFVEDLKGYMSIYEHVKKIRINKIDNKNTLQIQYIFSPLIEYIPLSKIKLCYMIDEETLVEVFRYEK